MDFLTEIMQAMFKVLKEKKKKIALSQEYFLDRVILREFLTAGPALQEILSGSLRWNEKMLNSNMEAH